jgi:hypothetical protein
VRALHEITKGAHQVVQRPAVGVMQRRRHEAAAPEGERHPDVDRRDVVAPRSRGMAIDGLMGDVQASTTRQALELRARGGPGERRPDAFVVVQGRRRRARPGRLDDRRPRHPTALTSAVCP